MYVIHHTGGAVNGKKMPKAEAEAYVARVNGKATVTLEEKSYRLPTGEWSVTYRYDRQPECEHKCPIGRINAPK